MRFIVFTITYVVLPATRNFEMQIKMKSSSKDNDKEKEKEYLFAGIYRTEYPFLNEHVKSKEITIDNPFVSLVVLV